MGQAKQRGNFEQRRALAEERNRQIDMAIKRGSPVDKYRQEHGTQRLVTRLVMAGAMLPPISFTRS